MGDLIVQPGISRVLRLLTRNSATGALTNATSQTVTWHKTGAGTQTLTPTNVGTGTYTVDTAGLSASIGDTGDLVHTATTDATDSAIVGRLRFDNTTASVKAKTDNLPSFAAGQTGGLLTLGTGTGQISVAGGVLSLGTNAPSGWINAAAIASSAFSSAKFANGAFTIAKFASDVLPANFGTLQIQSGQTIGTGTYNGPPAEYLADPSEEYDDNNLIPSNIAVRALSSEQVTLAIIVAGGTAPYAYQWHVSATPGFTPGSGTAIPGATSATLTHSPTGKGPHYYCVTGTDSNGGTYTSYKRPVWLLDWPLDFSPQTNTPKGKQVRFVLLSDSRGTGLYSNGVTPISAMAEWLPANTSLIVTTANYSVASTTSASYLANNYVAALAAEGGSFAGAYVFLDFGVNEAQGGQSASVLIAGMKALAARCLSDGAAGVFVNYPTFREPGSQVPSTTNVYPDEPYTSLIQSYQVALDAWIGQPYNDGNGNPVDVSKILVGDRKTYYATAMLPQNYLYDRLHPNKAGVKLMGRHMAEAALAGLNREHDVTALRSIASAAASAGNADSTAGLILSATNSYGTATSAALSGVAAGVQTIGEAVGQVTDKLPDGGQKIAGVGDVQLPSPGGYTQTLTIRNANTNALIPGAEVRYTQGGVTIDTATANGSGVASIAVPAGTYTRTVIARGYDGASASATVSADGSATITLSPVTSGGAADVSPGLAN